VPFFGAGASYGGHAADGSLIPLGDDLKDLIAARFLGAGYEKADFANVCDFAITESSVRELQKFLQGTLFPFGPADHHLLLPTFRWAGLATTNYDLVVERAYERVTTPAQALAPFCKDEDGSLDRLTPQSVLYVKLHGCINHYQDVSPPFIASTEQVINHREGRAQQFAQLLEWGQTKTIIFIGYGMGDSKLRAFVDELRREGDKRPRHYLLRPGIKSPEVNYWADRRITALDMTYEQFIRELDGSISSAARALSALHRAEGTTFTRFIARAGRAESAPLRAYLASRCEHLSDKTDPGTGSPAKFYNGFDLGWYPVAADLDVPRRIARSILEEQFAGTTAAGGPKFALVKSHAGGGKSVLLRRLAWDASHSLGRLVFYVRDAGAIDVDAFEEIASLVNQTIYLVVDDVSDGSERLEQLLLWARSKQVGLAVVGGARYNEWNVRCEHLSSRLNEVYELGYLTSAEIDGLLEKLERSGCLGSLATLNPDQRRERLQEVYGRQLLVALHEATRNRSFEDIIEDEYTGIRSPAAQILYRDICAINRLGPPVRAGLIARVHNIAFEDFEAKFFKPLEHIVDTRFDPRVRNYVYAARHPFIAEMVYRASLKTVDERFENISSIIGKLNPSYSYDEEVLGTLVRGNSLAELFPDRTMGEAIYNVVEDNLGRTSFLLHQRGIYEMRLAGDLSALDRAQVHLDKALELRPGNASIKHSLAELSLKRANVTHDPIERDAWLRRAENAASALSKIGGGTYGHHTVAKVAIAELRDAIGRSTEDDALAEEALSQAIRKAEEAIRSGLQRNPNDDRLLNEEATFNELLERADRMVTPLRKAFAAAPKSELICRRLARVLIAQGQLPEALEVLRKGLDLNPGSQALNFAMAQAIRETAPDADKTRAAELLHHLRRSFGKGDKNYEAQFWFARQIAISSDPTGSIEYFQRLKRLPLPYEQRRRPRGPVLNADGSPARFYGAIYRSEPSYGFIRADENGLEVFFKAPPEPGGNELHVGLRVAFGLEFTLSGAFATDVVAAS
jgi:tetratricopeptide (TPR) repeat protein